MSNLIWFRRDFRLQDNEALSKAAASGKPALCIYIHDEKAAGRHTRGGASRIWLHHALLDLQRSLNSKGLNLYLAKGDTVEILTSLAREHKITDFYANKHYEPAERILSARVFEAFEKMNVRCHGGTGSYLMAPDSLKTQKGEPYRVFTPFYKALLTTPPAFKLTTVPARMKPSEASGSLRVDDLGLLPAHEPDWYTPMMKHWDVGENAAHKLLKEFLKDKAGHYKEQRDVPVSDITSRLSPYLHFGHITARQIWHVCNECYRPDLEPFMRQLVWREFSLHLLHHNPEMDEKPLQEKFLHFPWKENAHSLKAWQQGQTGYPIVDAAMRCLWATGWMHNRLRMVTASFLVKHLQCKWQDGESWFWDTLVDADLANNSASWQWVAGCGADAAPYFRIFNPILQGEKFDESGKFVREWCPELNNVPDKFVHKPWAWEKFSTLNYPDPIVDHDTARKQALASYQMLKSIGE